MKYLVIALLALVLGGLIGRSIWGEKKQEPVDPVQVILTQVRTHAVIEHERQVAIWYRACPAVLGKTPTIFMVWPAKLVYQLELGDVQIKKTGTVIKVTTAAIHSEEPSVPTDFVDYLSTTSIFTFANEQELVNHEISKASPLARYLTTYFLTHDPSLQDDFGDELRTLIEHLAGALAVPVTSVDVDIPKVTLTNHQWPKLPKLELCTGTMASVNGLPFATNMDNGDTVPVGFRPPPSRRSQSAQQKTAAARGTSAGVTSSSDDAPKGTATLGPPRAMPVPAR
ncbi:MAG TPA: hypothetical protein VNY82_00360 [Steroidobacteraceae bacterium]|nr:hypothetical protein [Steroidobacteraceae bacterium]